jgi:hypothetical protein
MTVRDDQSVIASSANWRMKQSVIGNEVKQSVDLKIASFLAMTNFLN